MAGKRDRRAQKVFFLSTFWKRRQQAKLGWLENGTGKLKFESLSDTFDVKLQEPVARRQMPITGNSSLPPLGCCFAFHLVADTIAISS